METKKNQEVDLERWRSILLEIGFIVSLLLVYLSFLYKGNNKTETILGEMQEMPIETEFIPITRPKEVKPPPPPPPPKVVEKIEIVKNNEKVKDIDINSESSEDTKIDAPPLIDIGEPDENNAPVNFYAIKKKPEFPGGFVAMQKWIRDHVNYPDIAKANGVEGKVYIQFVIGKDGSVTNVEVLRPVDPYLDAEALRVIKSMPKWSPGEQRGKPVKVIFQLPVNFMLIH